jgi:hypothetical protein
LVRDKRKRKDFGFTIWRFSLEIAKRPAAKIQPWESVCTKLAYICECAKPKSSAYAPSCATSAFVVDSRHLLFAKGLDKIVFVTALQTPVSEVVVQNEKINFAAISNKSGMISLQSLPAHTAFLHTSKSGFEPCRQGLFISC